jgi:rhamnose utilization protein RhaD (predicted bifunctional aldolase and dehydrogenase)
MIDPTLTELIQLAHELGREDRQLAILGEGNLSANCGDGTFWVKASGSQMGTITPAGFSRVRFTDILELMDRPELDDAQVEAGLKAALTDVAMRRPSVETFLHAVCLHETQARFIGHTHPTSVLSILCSQAGAEPFLRAIFPEPIPICGWAPAVVPYTDPGLPLGMAVRDALRRHADRYGESPKMILMINHGLVALGTSPQQALNITLIADKWARILLASQVFGGPRYLSDEQFERILNRPDEKLRQKT